MTESTETITTPQVERDEHGAYHIAWNGCCRGPVAIYVQSSPEFAAGGRPVATVTGVNQAVIRLPDATGRRYFLLQPQRGAGLIVAERRIPLDGPVNFRDLGGYGTTDGRRVKWGLIYRSDSLAKLTDDDRSVMNELGVRRVYDFRSPAEVEKSPDNLPENRTVTYHHLPVVGSDFDTVAAVERLKRKDTSWLTETFMIDGYRRNIDAHAETWGAVIGDLSHDACRPLVFHCTAGKDRTGICAALILMVLGVPEDAVIADHALSNRYFESTIAAINDYIRSLGVDPETVKPYLTAPREAIEFTLAHIRKNWGTADNYLVTAAGLDPAVPERLRAELLE